MSKSNRKAENLLAIVLFGYNTIRFSPITVLKASRRLYNILYFTNCGTNYWESNEIFVKKNQFSGNNSSQFRSFSNEANFYPFEQLFESDFQNIDNLFVIKPNPASRRHKSNM